jgi:hypothetical protein
MDGLSETNVLDKATDKDKDKGTQETSSERNININNINMVIPGVSSIESID